MVTFMTRLFCACAHALVKTNSFLLSTLVRVCLWERYVIEYSLFGGYEQGILELLTNIFTHLITPRLVSFRGFQIFRYQLITGAVT